MKLVGVSHPLPLLTPTRAGANFPFNVDPVVVRNQSVGLIDGNTNKGGESQNESACPDFFRGHPGHALVVYEMLLGA